MSRVTAPPDASYSDEDDHESGSTTAGNKQDACISSDADSWTKPGNGTAIEHREGDTSDSVNRRGRRVDDDTGDTALVSDRRSDGDEQKRGDEHRIDLSELLGEEGEFSGELEQVIEPDTVDSADPGGFQRTLLAPAAIEWETRAARVGEQWTTTLYVAGYPDCPKDGDLSGRFDLIDVEFDLTVDLTPKNQRRARDELQNTADDLQAEADRDLSDDRAR